MGKKWKTDNIDGNGSTGGMEGHNAGFGCQVQGTNSSNFSLPTPPIRKLTEEVEEAEKLTSAPRGGSP